MQLRLKVKEFLSLPACKHALWPELQRLMRHPVAYEISNETKLKQEQKQSNINSLAPRLF
jgi:hypothetical protein